VSIAYLQPTQLPDALEILTRGRFDVLAGGTDYYPARAHRALVAPVLDVTRIAGLREIALNDGIYRIGAASTWMDVLRADLPPQFDGLKAAAREVGGVQIQNSGTLAGNLCNASPAADGVPALLALDAQIELCSAQAKRVIPLTQFILGPRHTARAPHELVTAIVLPHRPRARSNFLKLGSRRYLVISIAMVSALIETNASGRIAYAAIAVGSCSAVAQRLPALEARLLGLLPAEVHLQPVPTDLDNLKPIDDVRGSGEYRKDAALTLVRRALEGLQ
jgi:CO/xanthine dehydrogenase FAD-binding subunit